MNQFYEVTSEYLGNVKQLVSTVPYDTLIDASVNGYHGKIYVDHLEEPTMCQILIADFTFFIGDANHPLAIELIYNVPKWIIAVPTSDQWKKLILQHHHNHCEITKRFSFTHETIDKELLLPLINQLPQQYKLKRIDKELAFKVMQERWCDGMVINFKGINDYLENGLGFCILEDDKIVAGASSYIRFNGGIEVEIDTRPDYRKQGLATIVGAYLIHYCLEHNLVPHWDAENDYSIRIAEKFGYTIDRIYEAFIISYF